MTHCTPKDILDFWFADGMEERWYVRDDAFDQELRDRFLDVHHMANNGQLDHWEDTREGRLALILIFDQFSRNLYRGSPQAFASDAKARKLAACAVDMEDDLWFKAHKGEHWRAFLYVVFMHSEHIEDQRRCLHLYTTHGPKKNIPFAQEHLDVISRFGRFPSRNKALGRVSTPQEKEFLTTHIMVWA